MKPQRFELEDGRGGAVSASLLAPGACDALLVLAHGAGAGMDHSFMTAMQERLGERGIAVLLFNFPYKQRGGRAPDKTAVLEACYRAVVEQVRGRAAFGAPLLLIGGKSMGGRMATHIAAAGCAVDGLVLLGYPLNPAGRPKQQRSAHLPAITVPMLFVQGTRDPLCNLDDLRAVLGGVAAPAEVYVVEGGDHSFKVPKRSGRDEGQVLSAIAAECSRWVGSLKPQK